jgi:hypothetical protein
MKHFLHATTGIALALAVAGTAKTASADVDVVANITKTKDIEILENITIRKQLTIDVDVAFVLEGGAEAQALLNVTNQGNHVDGQDIPGDPAGVDEYGILYDAELVSSVNGNRGVWGFNQDVGNMTNQANVVSVAGIDDLIESFAQSQAHVDQLNTLNVVREEEVLRDEEGNHITDLSNLDPDLFRANKSATIARSINDNSGIINVNQNAGNMNNQSNAVAAAVGIGAELALSEGDLGQENSHNTVDELETVKVSTIQGSINGNSGIVNVNQSTGNMNNQGNVVSISAITSGAFINTNVPNAVP